MTQNLPDVWRVRSCRCAEFRNKPAVLWLSYHRPVFRAVLILTLVAGLRAQPPAAKRVEFRETLHATELLDPYHWLEDFDDAAARSWIAGQDRFARALLEKLPGQESLRRRMLELSATDRITLPILAANRFFYQRSTPSSPQPLECYRDGVAGAEKIWLDHAEAPKNSSITRMRISVSVDGKLAAYAVRTSGQDEVEIRFSEVDTGRDLPDKLPKALYSSISFLPDRSAVFYGVRSRDTGARVRFHKLGADSQGREVFGKGLDARVFLSATVSRDGRWLTMQAQHGWAGADLYVQDLKVAGPVRRLTHGIDAQFITTACGPSKMLLTTTWKAPRKRALLVQLERPEQTN